MRLRLLLWSFVARLVVVGVVVTACLASSITWCVVGVHVSSAVLLSHDIGAQVLGVRSWELGVGFKQQDQTKDPPALVLG